MGGHAVFHYRPGSRWHDDTARDFTADKEVIHQCVASLWLFKKPMCNQSMAV